ncbi:MAG: HEAT repeat domain-containing protein [Terriglobia bacterium]
MVKRAHLIAIALLLLLAIFITVSRFQRKSGTPESQASKTSISKAFLDPSPHELDITTTASGLKATQESPPSASENVKQSVPRVSTPTLDAVFRTEANAAKIKTFAQLGLITSDLARILLGEEDDRAVLAREFGNLVQILEKADGDLLLRRYAASALGLYKDDAALGALLRTAASEADSRLRNAAFWTASIWIPERNEVSDSFLREVAGGKTSLTRNTALAVLAEKGVEVPATILVQLANEDAGLISMRAVGILAEQNGRRSMPQLEQLAVSGSSQAVREEAARALAALKESGVYKDPRPKDSYNVVSGSPDGNAEKVLVPIDFPLSILTPK